MTNNCSSHESNQPPDKDPNNLSAPPLLKKLTRHLSREFNLKQLSRKVSSGLKEEPVIWAQVMPSARMHQSRNSQDSLPRSRYRSLELTILARVPLLALLTLLSKRSSHNPTKQLQLRLSQSKNKLRLRIRIWKKQQATLSRHKLSNKDPPSQQIWRMFRGPVSQSKLIQLPKKRDHKQRLLLRSPSLSWMIKNWTILAGITN